MPVFFEWYTKENANGGDPDALRRILELGKDDWVSQYVALNPSCPPDALAQVLARHKDDWVSQWAASNPSCPPDALTQVLARHKNDGVSWLAARNPNCPLDAKMRWYALFAPEPDRPDVEEPLFKE